MKTRISAFLLVLAIGLLAISCSEEGLNENQFAGFYVGTIQCSLELDSVDVPIDDLPYLLTITNSVDGDGKINLDDNAILDPFLVNVISNSMYSRTESQTIDLLEVNDTTEITGISVTVSVTGTLDGDNLNHSFSVIGDSDQGTISLTCSGDLTK